MKLPDPMTGSLCLGRSVHKAVAIYFRERLRGNLIDTTDAIEAYELAWEENAEDTQFAADEDVAGTKGAGATLVAKYLAEAVPKVEPAALDLHVTGEIGSVAVQGYIDILAADGTIIDLKTAKAKPSGVSSDYAFQIATYRQLCPQSNGKAKLTTLVRTKTPQRVEQEYTVSAEDQTQTRVLYPLVQQSIREGRYLPNRNDNLCSRRNCAFWAACEKEYGGRVEE
jgi:hypothetical protein